MSPCNCGGKASARTQYRVRLNNGDTKIVDSVAAARIAIATGGGGTFKAVPAK